MKNKVMEAVSRGIQKNGEVRLTEFNYPSGMF